MSWLQDYHEYTRNQESPDWFHLWVGTLTIASVLGRQVWMPRRSHGVTWYSVYPGQLMVTLVAPPGKGHKGTAMRSGNKLMRAAGVHVIKGKGSTEGLIKNLANIPSNAKAPSGRTLTSSGPVDAIATLYVPELSVFLSKANYADSLVDFLTDIYDAEDPFTYTLSAGDITLRNPCVSLIAGATPESIGKSIPEKAQGTGYLSRVVHVYHEGDEKKINDLTDLDDSEFSDTERQHQLLLERNLSDGLIKMRQLSGAFHYSKSGKDWYREWYKSWRASYDGQTEGWGTRRADHLLRIAMILRVSAFYDLELDAEALIAADRMLARVEIDHPKAFARIGEDEMARNKDRILAVMRRAGGQVCSSDLIAATHRFFRSHNEFLEAMRVLLDGEFIETAGVSGNKIWYKIKT